METKVISRNVLGIKVNDVSDIMKYATFGDGFGICNEDGYTFTEYIVDIDEDGETEREPTEKEVLDRAIRAFNKGQNLYATIYVGCADLVPKAATTLQCAFRVGQEVYTMLDNKIARGEIEHITLTKALNPMEMYVDFKSRDLVRRICNHILYECFPAGTKDYYQLKCRDDVERDIKTAVSDASVIIRIGQTRYTRGMGEIFATKEELVKDLMG